MSWPRVGVILLLPFALLGGSVGARSGIGTEIGLKDRANANASIATNGAFVSVVWAARTKDGVTDIVAATSRDGGRSFRAPVRVNQVVGDASVSGEQPPRIGLLARRASDPSIVVLWTAKSSPGTRLVMARSNDGGQSFGPTESVSGSDATGNRGWESMAISRSGEAVALWLDHRDVPARATGGTHMSGAHQHGATNHLPTDGAARAQLSQLFFAKLNERGGSRAITGGVCYCCKTSVATGRDGSIFAAWRHVYPGNVRDIAFTKSSDGGRSFALPARVSEDNWVLDGCPENGPALAVDEANAVHIVWPTLVQDRAKAEPTLALFYATSSDGRRFTTRQRIPTEGVPRHPQIALGPAGEMTVAWDEQARGRRRIVVAHGTVDGKNSVRLTRQPIDDQPGSYPAIAPVQDGTIVAWTSGTAERTSLRVERLPTKR